MNSAPPYHKRWYVLGVLCIVLFIISIDNTVLNLALPSIANGLGASASELQWIVDAYTLVFASLLITTGSIGDRYGRKRMLLAGLALFGLGSLGAALSRSTFVLIGFRALLGLAGAMVMPPTLSIIVDVFRNPRERAQAIALWSSIFSIGAGIGPIVGGLLIHSFDWSSVFFLNVPIVAIGLTGIFLWAPESGDARAPRPDVPGVLLSITGLVTLVYGMIRAGESGWTAPPVLAAFGLAAVLLGAFVAWENHSATPMLPLVFFKNRSFTGANTALTLSAFAMMGSMYFTSQFLQSVQGYTPVLAALAMLPMTPIVFLMTMNSVRVNRRLGSRLTVPLGLLLSGSGLFLFSRVVAMDMPYWPLLLFQFLNGSGIGLTMSPATSAVMNSLPPERAGIGSAMNDTTRQVGGALGVAVLGSLMNGAYRVGVGALAGTAGLSESLLEQIRSSVQGAHVLAAGLDPGLASAVVQASSQAFVQGMARSQLIGSAIMVLAATCAFLILPKKS